MEEKIRIPKKKKRSENFTVRFTIEERNKLDKFCIKKQIKLAELIRFSLKEVMERAR